MIFKSKRIIPPPRWDRERERKKVCDLLGFGHVPSRGRLGRRRRQLYFDLTSIHTYIHTYKLYTHTHTTTTKTTKKNIKQRPSLYTLYIMHYIQVAFSFFLTPVCVWGFYKRNKRVDFFFIFFYF